MIDVTHHLHIPGHQRPARENENLVVFFCGPGSGCGLAAPSRGSRSASERAPLARPLRPAPRTNPFFPCGRRVPLTSLDTGVSAGRSEELTRNVDFTVTPALLAGLRRPPGVDGSPFLIHSEVDRWRFSSYFLTGIEWAVHSYSESCKTFDYQFPRQAAGRACVLT